MAAQSNKLNRSEIDLVLSKHAEDKEAELAGGGKRKDGLILWLGVAGGTSMIFFSLLLYAFPMLFLLDTEELIAFEDSQKLEQCRLVFEQIGYRLEDGLVIEPELRCAETNVPNIVERRGDTVRVLLPNPSDYGVSAMYVSNDTHEVVVEG